MKSDVNSMNIYKIEITIDFLLLKPYLQNI